MSYIVLQNRIDSFSKPKRKKGSSKTAGLKWPHPSHYLANPETLAEAGFYFDPSAEDKDNVRCFMCNKEIGEWAEDDDPHAIHFGKCGKTCSWAIARCGVEMDKDKKGRFEFKDKNRLPTSKAMEKARLQTFAFENRWPHDQVSNHGANSKNMARAGFVYLPTHDLDDLATCIYCGICLNGWDEEDDPLEEHRKRVAATTTGCAMFPDIVVKASKSKSKAKTSHMDVLEPTKQHDGTEDEEEDVRTQKASTSTAKTPRKPRNTKGAKTPGTSRTRSSSRSRQTTAGLDEDEDEDEEVESRGVTPAPTNKAQKKSVTGTRARTRSKSMARTAADHETDEDAGAPVPAPKRKASTTRSRAKSKGPGEGADSDDPRTTTKTSTRTRSKSKARVSIIPEDVAGPSAEEDVDIPEETTTTRSTKSRSTKAPSHARTQSKNSVDEANPASSVKSALASAFTSNARDDTTENDSVPSTKTRKTSKPPSSATTATSSKLSIQEELGTSTSRKRVGGHKRTASSASQKGKGRAPPPEIEENDEEDMDVDMELDLQMPPPAQPTEPITKPPSSKAKLNRTAPLPESESRPASRADTQSVTSKNRPPLSRMASAASSTGSDTAGVSKGMVKALASRYESEEPQAPPPMRPTRSQQGGFPVISPDKPSSSSTRAPAPVQRPLSRTGNGKPPSNTSKPAPPVGRKSRSQSRTGSGSDGDSREVDEELQIVEISSDEDIDENGARTPSPKKIKKKIKKTAGREKDEREERKENERPTTVAQQPAPTEHGRAVDVAVPKKTRDIMDAETAANEDVQMSDSQDTSGAHNPVERPVTPPAFSTATSLPKTPLPNGNVLDATNKPPVTPGFQFTPPLSKEPFVNLDTLSEKELTMTVEEWIRYQMGLEYEKFKKDGENELAAFQRKAEEVRRAIEAL